MKIKPNKKGFIKYPITIKTGDQIDKVIAKIDVNTCFVTFDGDWNLEPSIWIQVLDVLKTLDKEFAISVPSRKRNCEYFLTKNFIFKKDKDRGYEVLIANRVLEQGGTYIKMKNLNLEDIKSVKELLNQLVEEPMDVKITTKKEEVEMLNKKVLDLSVEELINLVKAVVDTRGVQDQENECECSNEVGYCKDMEDSIKKMSPEEVRKNLVDLYAFKMGHFIKEFSMLFEDSIGIGITTEGYKYRISIDFPLNQYLKVEEVYDLMVDAFDAKNDIALEDETSEK